MKHGKHLRKKENRAGRSVWHRCLAVLLSAAMLAGVMIPSAAGAGLGANVEFSAKIVKDTGDTAEAIQSVDSGDSFFLALDYKFSSSPDGVSYGGAAIAIQLPEYVKVDLAGSVVTSDFKQPEVAEVTPARRPGHPAGDHSLPGPHRPGTGRHYLSEMLF